MMKDIKSSALIIAPAALTLLGIMWFLRKKIKDDGKKTKIKKEDVTLKEKEGITLTERKIPEAASGQPEISGMNSQAPDTVGGLKPIPSKEKEAPPLSEKEKEKVKEIVETAIGAGLKKAQAEFKQKGKLEKNVVEESMIVPEHLSAQSSSPLQSNLNSTIQENNLCSKERNINDLYPNVNSQTTPDNQEQVTSAEHRPQTFSSQPLESIASQSSPLTSQDDQNISSNNNQSAIVPSKCTPVSMQPCEEAIVASSSAYLSCSVLPSNQASVDIAPVSDSNALSNSKPDLQADNAISSKPSDSVTSLNFHELAENVVASSTSGDNTKVRHPSNEQQGKKQEESPVNSSSPNCDNNSVDSGDSGRGGSEQDSAYPTNPDSVIHFNFNMPSDLCGKLIGRGGRNIQFIKSKSGASVSLTNNPITAQYQICQVVGSQEEVDRALDMIRKKFPVDDFPHLTMASIAVSVPKHMEAAPVLVPENMQLSLPDGASVEVYVSTIVDAGHVFVQQPTHRSFMSLEKLNFILQTVYTQDETIPSIPTPVECGVICVSENEGVWYRTMIMSPEDEYGQCQVKFVDYGGYTQLPVTQIKQIRADFMNLPFQAVECFVANISPLHSEEYFSTESTLALSEMSQMKVLQCQVVARNELGTPYIHLYCVSPDTNTATLLNRALVNEGFVQWVEIL